MKTGQSKSCDMILILRVSRPETAFIVQPDF